MPDLDEDTLRHLMVRATWDLVASRAATTSAIKRQRRHRTRVRVTAVAGAAAAAGLAAGIVVPAVGASSPLPRPRPAAPTTTPIQLTAAQRALFALSAAAAKTPRPHGRYVVLAEVATSIDPNGTAAPTKEVGGKTSVIDTLTGGGVQYQDITVTNADGTPVAPGTLKASPGTSPTRAQLDAMPTDPQTLRATLLKQAEEQQAQAQRFIDAARKKAGKKAYPVPKTSPRPETADDLVFEQAADLLWEPHLSPALRSALYKVLAATPGVTVQTNVTDSSGRAATEISRLNSVAGDIAETFEDPATGQTLESAWVGPGKSLSEDLYLSIHYTNAIPPNPYKA
jgi:hypothetical protein